jgi:hypothetical protein
MGRNYYDITDYTKDTSDFCGSYIKQSDAVGNYPTLKNNMNIKFTNKKGKVINGRVKQTCNNGYVDIIVDEKVYLCVWKRDKWIEK